MANWNNPTLSSLYTDVLTEFKNRDVDAITLLKDAATNIPTGSIRWNRSTLIFEEWNGSAWVAMVVGVAGGGTGSATAAAARTALGLGTMATQNSNAVSITGGNITGLASLGVSGVITGNGSGLTSIPNSATTATSANTASTIVARDSGGNFTAGVVTAASYFSGNVIGNASTVTNGVYNNASNTYSGSVIQTSMNQPRGRIYLSASQSVSSAGVLDDVGASLLCDTVSTSFGRTHADMPASLASPTIQFEGVGPGIYAVSAQLTWLAGGGDMRKLTLNEHTSGQVVARSEVVPSATKPVVLNFTVFIRYTGSNEPWYTVRAYQNSGGSLNAYGASDGNTWVQVMKIW